MVENPANNLGQKNQEPQNHWIEKVTKQVGSLDVNPRYLSIRQQNPGENASVNSSRRDELTGVFNETDNMRTFIASRLGRTIKEGEKWVCIYADVDNLKAANTKIGRPFGDAIIKWGAKQVSNTLDQVDFNDATEIYFIRSKDGADESMVWIMGLEDNQIEALSRGLNKAQEPIILKDPVFTLSTSAVLISSEEPSLKEEIKKTKDWLEKKDEETRSVPFNFYQQIKNKVEVVVKGSKIIKDLVRLSGTHIMEKFAEIDINALVELFVNDFGDSRISSDLLKILFEIVSIKSVITPQMAKGAAAFVQVIAPQELAGPGEKMPPERIHQIFQDIFGKSE